MPGALHGCRVIALATNIPGPIAASRLATMGASVLKIEPLAGDPLQYSAPRWYETLCTGVTVERRDLREASQRARLHDELRNADLLLTTLRASALDRSGLAWEALQQLAPRLCHVALFGEAPPNDSRAGHDLTYQVRSGYATPPAMPRTLIADMAAAERAVSASLEALLSVARGGPSMRQVVAIVDAANAFAAPRAFGLTADDGALGGGLDTYRFYRAKDGWLAVALLESHFADRFVAVTGVADLSAASLETCAATRGVDEWDALAREYDLPLAGVKDPGVAV